MTVSSITQVVRQEPGQLARRFGSSRGALSAVPGALANVACLLIGLLADPRLSDARRRNDAWLARSTDEDYSNCRSREDGPDSGTKSAGDCPTTSPRARAPSAALLGIVREARR